MGRNGPLVSQSLTQLLRREPNFLENLAQEGPSQVSTAMVRHCCRTSIGVTVQHVATSLAYRGKAQLTQDAIEGAEVKNRQAAHAAISICWRPANRGRSSAEPPRSRYSSR